MADSSTRQHYRLATGEGLTSAPSKTPNPGFAKGGRVPKSKAPKMSKKGGRTRC